MLIGSVIVLTATGREPPIDPDYVGPTGAALVRIAAAPTWPPPSQGRTLFNHWMEAGMFMSWLLLAPLTK
jgi:hypothetical protein